MRLKLQKISSPPHTLPLVMILAMIAISAAMLDHAQVIPSNYAYIILLISLILVGVCSIDIHKRLWSVTHNNHNEKRQNNENNL